MSVSYSEDSGFDEQSSHVSGNDSQTFENAVHYIFENDNDSLTDSNRKIGTLVYTPIPKKNCSYRSRGCGC
jgi:hypothetical protein